MNYHGISKDDTLNGSGIRAILWLSGCSHNCKGCHNPVTHNANNGELFTEQIKDDLISYLSNDYVAGLTLSGGDPLHYKNIKEVINLCKEIKQKLPNKNIWLYTGYTLEQIQESSNLRDVLNYIDVLVDGRFVESLKDSRLEYRGSSNQRIIRLNEAEKQ